MECNGDDVVDVNDTTVLLHDRMEMTSKSSIVRIDILCVEYNMIFVFSQIFTLLKK